VPKLTHFEIAADDAERAVNFYRRVFGWDIQSDEESGEDYWLISPKQDEVEITGGIFPRLSWSDSTINTFEVSSIDGFARKIVDAGGKIIEEVPLTIPGVGYQHYCEDSEGNVFGIIQYDERAR
jgi:predicted enzyme related to lactoylglutathione lyase